MKCWAFNAYRRSIFRTDLIDGFAPCVETTLAAFEGGFTPRTVRAEAGPAAPRAPKGA
jgi:hypothetical protein